MIISPTTKLVIISSSVVFVLGTLLGIGIGWKLYHPEQVVETYKPAIVWDNGTVALERKPNLPPPVEIKQAAKKLHGKLERTAQIKIQPKPSQDSPAGCKCDDITVDVGVVDQGDGKRIVAYTDDGTILGGTDTPLEPYVASKTNKWEIGVLVPIDNPKGIGPTVARYIGPFKVGIAAAELKEDGWSGFVVASVAF